MKRPVASDRDRSGDTVDSRAYPLPPFFLSMESKGLTGMVFVSIDSNGG